MRAQTQSLQRAQAVATAVAVLVAMLSAVGVVTASDEEARDLLRRVINQTTRSGIAARAIRQLQAGTVSGKHQASMKVETTLASSGAFSWNVIEEEGSERTRDKVFRAVLDAEAEQWRGGANDRAALSPANYVFTPQGQSASGLTVIRVTPKRAEPTLIDGTLTVDAEGYPVVLQGRMAKSPSFWVKSVTVVKRYGRFSGVALPVVIESLADIKMFGKSSFTMRYTYREVNGRSVSHAAAAASPSFGPSPEILAVYAAHQSR